MATATAKASTSDDKFLKVNFRDVLPRLWPTLRPHRGQFVFGIVLILLTTAIEIASPILIGHAVDVAAAPEHNRHLLIQLCLVYLGFIFSKFVLDSLQGYVIQKTGQQITHALRALLFSKVQSLSIPYYDQNPTGRLLTRVINDIKSLSELFTASISVLALDLMIIFGTIVAMFLMHWKLSALVLFSFPLMGLTIRYFGMRLALSYRRVRLRLAEINAFLGENIGAIATIQRLAAENERLQKFAGISNQHQVAQIDSLNVFAMVQPIANTLNGISMGTLIIVGGYWVIQGRITIGLLVVFLGYLRNLFQPVRDLVEKYNTFLSAMVSAERVMNILEEPGEQELTGGETGISELMISKAPLHFQAVSFRYPTRNANALSNINFSLPAGKSLAIVGATGSGKSTIIRLLLRFYEPTSGEIMFGGVSLSAWDRFQLRRHVGVVHQEIYLFQGTVRENLTLGREGITDPYLIAQCRRAQLWNFIESRGGLDMAVQEGGSNFSIGEKQLISFARILVFDTPVLILDEATSNMDRITEKKLMAAIHETLRGRTSIVIAHRLSTIRECDQIIVLEHGDIVERGDYPELVKMRGLFRKFHDIHSRG